MLSLKPSSLSSLKLKVRLVVHSARGPNADDCDHLYELLCLECLDCDGDLERRVPVQLITASAGGEERNNNH